VSRKDSLGNEGFLCGCWLMADGRWGRCSLHRRAEELRTQGHPDPITAALLAEIASRGKRGKQKVGADNG
jgi:hypothetical protein